MVYVRTRLDSCLLAFWPSGWLAGWLVGWLAWCNRGGLFKLRSRSHGLLRSTTLALAPRPEEGFRGEDVESGTPKAGRQAAPYIIPLDHHHTKHPPSPSSCPSWGDTCMRYFGPQLRPVVCHHHPWHTLAWACFPLLLDLLEVELGLNVPSMWLPASAPSSHAPL